ncbi:hypothetical protein ebA107 [Aromatoleum aromaticum EbN1]|uniref:Uncharacterized protein n=1 Tax=Aromatoleum aromaticum (strain DSM 19018 / LMG 30748 / EbN1) TaxID=76114 RepID=Q5P927_AROAE|nr:hypothetical protein ebA107 [Aromatoleum aromaticum EbN1]
MATPPQAVRLRLLVSLFRTPADAGHGTRQPMWTKTSLVLATEIRFMSITPFRVARVIEQLRHVATR